MTFVLCDTIQSKKRKFDLRMPGIAMNLAWAGSEVLYKEVDVSKDWIEKAVRLEGGMMCKGSFYQVASVISELAISQSGAQIERGLGRTAHACLVDL